MQKDLLKIFIVVFIVCIVTCEKQPKMIIEIINEGAYTPKSSFGKIFEQPWMQGLGSGQLTNTGRRQQYLLGRRISVEYSDLFKDVLDSEEISVKSIRYDRHFGSAQSHITGMFLEKMEVKFDEKDLRLAPPFPMTQEERTLNTRDSIPGDPETILIIGDNPNRDTTFRLHSPLVCPKTKRSTSSYSRELSEKLDLQKELERMVKKLGIALTRYDNLALCSFVAEFMVSKYFNDPNSGLDPKEEDFRNIERCIAGQEIYKYADDSQVKLVGSSLGLKISSLITNKIKELQKKNKNSKTPIFSLYSTENETLVPLLLSLGILNKDCLSQELFDKKKIKNCVEYPKYASSLIFELEYDTLTDKYGVKTRFNGKYYQICKQDDHSKSEVSCPFNDFISLFNRTFREDWYEYCGLDHQMETISNSNTQKILIVLLTLINLILLVLMAGFVLFYFKKKRDRKISVNTEQFASLGSHHE